MRGVFVTGTDTGAGKSIVAAAICAALAARGERVGAFKPVVTGLDEPPGEWPPDHELLVSVASAGQSPEDVAPYRFGPAASPHLAAPLEGVSVDRSVLLGAASGASARADVLVVEGVGGLMVPLTEDYLVRDLAAELGLPVIVAARPGLGTINHTLLTVQAARAAGLAPAGVVLTPSAARPSAVEASNQATIERLADVSVSSLPPIRRRSLAQAGSSLPLAEWLAKAGRSTSARSAPPARTPPARTRTARRGAAAAAASPAGGRPGPGP
jgi:dethiobiotin synthetase